MGEIDFILTNAQHGALTAQTVEGLLARSRCPRPSKVQETTESHSKRCPETHPAQCRPGKHSRTLQSFRGQGTGSERKIRRRKWKESTTCVGSTRCDTWSRRRATSRDIVERDAESKQNRRVAGPSIW